MPLWPFSAPPLDEPSVRWICDVFAWALQHLDAAVFRDETLLVTPTNAHFPGRAASAEQLANLMFERTLAYAGMRHWPARLMAPGALVPEVAHRPVAPLPLRGAAAADAAPGPTVPVGYDPALVSNPEAMIAGFAQVLAHHLGAAVPHAPPGGIENWAQTTEVLGVFLGFGLMFANTAAAAPVRSCGSCGGPPAQRQSYLSQYDLTYALAVFCTLKDLPSGAVLPHLKRSLRPYFKRCRRDLGRRRDALDALRRLIDGGRAAGSAATPLPAGSGVKG